MISQAGGASERTECRQTEQEPGTGQEPSTGAEDQTGSYWTTAYEHD